MTTSLPNSSIPPKELLPGILFIEFTNHCNMHCSFCPSDILSRKREHLDEENLNRFLEQIHLTSYRPAILCNVLGEPLLNKKIYSFLDLFEKEGHEVTLITNAILLREESVRQELLKHSNLTIALSIQTVTPNSWKMRGCASIGFKDFMKIPYYLMEEKFKTGSKARIEIHVALNYSLINDPTVSLDTPVNLWANFPDQKTELKWIYKYIKKLDKFARKIEKKFNPFFISEKERITTLYKEQMGTKISIRGEQFPENFPYLPEERYWGYMFLPHVFLRFKLLGLWTRDYSFVKSLFPKDKFIYIEDNNTAQPCSMTRNLGILANGDIILCCLDYEGEMKLGNIGDSHIFDLLNSKQLAQIHKNAMLFPVCRRCKGNLFVFDTSPIKLSHQRIQCFGQGWYPFEKEMHGIGGRWSSDCSTSYIFTRISATKLRICFLSEHDSSEWFSLEFYSYNSNNKSFSLENESFFSGEKGKISTHEILYRFNSLTFYKILLKSPTFIPDLKFSNGDSRSLGLAVFMMELSH